MNVRPLLAAGTLLGIGMGGFVDGILFHQILQLHNMLSNVVLRETLVNEEINMFWDGLFHAFTWLATAIAICMLWNAAKRQDVPLLGRAFAGAAVFGWGVFNLVEGVIDHEILQLHHFYQNGPHLLWDLVFLASGVVFIAAGWFVMRTTEVSAA
jgi:uncharacterized membrane protein